MKILNRKSKEIIESKEQIRFSPFISFLASEKNVHFPVSSVTLCGLRIGMFVHFVEIGPKCYGFIVNNNPDGFQLYANSKRDHALRIGCGGFTKLFKDELKLKSGRVSFYIQKTQTELKGQAVYEILTSRSREQILKDAK